MDGTYDVWMVDLNIHSSVVQSRVWEVKLTQGGWWVRMFGCHLRLEHQELKLPHPKP